MLNFALFLAIIFLISYIQPRIETSMTKVFFNIMWTTIILSFLTSCSVRDDATEDSLINIDYSSSQKIISLVNNYRTENSLDILNYNETAKNLAIEHAKYMSEKGELSISNNEERESILRDKENASIVLEFNARYYDASTLFNQWLNSPSTNSFLLGDYQQIGVGVVRDKNNKLYYTTIIFRTRD